MDKGSKQTFKNLSYESDDEEELNNSDPPPSYQAYSAPFKITYEPTMDELDDETIDFASHLPLKHKSKTPSLNQVPDRRNNPQTKSIARYYERLKTASIKMKKELKDAAVEGCAYLHNRCTPKYYGNTRKCLWYFSKKWLPCLRWLPRYSLRDLWGDVIAGVTTGLAVLVQGLAYTSIAEIDPLSHGLYSSIMGSYAYAVLGGVNEVSVSSSINVNILVADYATNVSPIPHHYAYPTILAFFSGIILLLCGFFKLGFVFNFVSMPVWKAFRAAACIIILTNRIIKWWGLKGIPKNYLDRVYWAFKRITETNWIDFLLGVGFLCVLWSLKKLKSFVWAETTKLWQKTLNIIFWILGTERVIITVAIGSLVTYELLKYSKPVSHVPLQPVGVPLPSIPNFTLTIPPVPNSTHNITTYRSFLDIARDIGPGFFFVPTVIMYEHLSTGSTFARKFNQRLDFNTELIAMGASNILTSTIRGYPVTGVLTRSNINFGAGVRTPASGILAGTIVIIAATYFSHVFYYFPYSAMAASIILGAIDICSFHKFKYIWFANKKEIFPWLVTFIGSLCLGIQRFLSTTYHHTFKHKFETQLLNRKIGGFSVTLKWGVPLGIIAHTMMDLFHKMYPQIVKKERVTMDRVKGSRDLISHQHLHLHIQEYPTNINFLSANQLHNYFIRHIAWNDEALTSIEFDLRNASDIDTSIIYKFKIIQELCSSRKIKFTFTNLESKVEEKIRKTCGSLPLNIRKTASDVHLEIP